MDARSRLRLVRGVRVALVAVVTLGVLGVTTFLLVRGTPKPPVAAPAPSSSPATTALPSSAGPSTTAPSATAPATTGSPTTRAAQAPSVAVAYIGDGVSGAAGDWTELVSAAMGQDGTPTTRRVAGEDGAGYVSRGVRGHVFSELLPSVVTVRTGVVVLVGSRNDVGSASAVGDAARVTLQAARDASPTAVLVVIGPVPVAQEAPRTARTLAVVDQDLRDAAAAEGAVFIDPVKDHWALGSSASSTTGGGLQLAPAGQRYVAAQVWPHLQPLVAARAQPTGSPSR